jgi:glycosyltransferase involved in cell wall biosynthesis
MKNKVQSENNILLLTPVKNCENYLETYFHNLYQLNYPHKKISIGLLESDSIDNSYFLIKEKLPDLQKEFAKVILIKKDFDFIIPIGTPRWSGKYQQKRRTILAKSRNHLLSRALTDEDWVLWLDVDLEEYPPDVIQKLLQTGKEIVQPHCVWECGGKTYDLNAWRDKGKKHLQDLRQDGEMVELHAVGGTMLLVKADIHRDGLIFPPYLYGRKNKRIRNTNFFFATRREKILGLPRLLKLILSGKYQGEIETEGLGIMAHDMGYKCWGMPNLEIKHYKQF